MGYRECPYCKKNDISHKAKVCPYCTREIEPMPYWMTRQGSLIILLGIVLFLAIWFSGCSNGGGGGSSPTAPTSPSVTIENFQANYSNNKLTFGADVTNTGSETLAFVAAFTTDMIDGTYLGRSSWTANSGETVTVDPGLSIYNPASNTYAARYVIKNIVDDTVLATKDITFTIP